MPSTQGQQFSQHDHLNDLGPAVEDHGRAVTASLRASTWYRQAQRAIDRRRATTALRLAVEADPAFELALADLDAMYASSNNPLVSRLTCPGQAVREQTGYSATTPISGTSGQRHSRRQMNWERHHIEIVRAAASGNGKRAADLLREHLAGVGCDPLAFRIVAQMRQPAGTDDDIEDLARRLPDCHPTRWPSSP
jgi:DNA-binding FadR family transcriptional regulator